jgi:CheY-like chemotaxis protein
VHGIVLAHDGAITVESQPGQGTTFHLYFPALTGPGAATDTVTTQARTGQGQHILLLDDEPALTASHKRLLERQKYRVTICHQPSEALEAFRANPAGFDLPITDLTMPEMNGLEVTREFHALHPELPVILVSGHAPDLTRKALDAAGIAELLEKPISPTALAEVVQRALKID